MTTGIVQRRRAVALELIRHQDIIRELDRAGFIVTTENVQRARALREEYDRLSTLSRGRIPKPRARYGMEAGPNERATNGARGHAGRDRTREAKSRVLAPLNGGRREGE